MSVTRAFTLILGICFVVAPLAQAQRPGGGFGGGGFGGGGFGGGGNVISTEAVQKELGLSTEQTDKLKLITEEAQKSMRGLFQRPAEGEDREKARAAMQEKMQAAAKELTSKVEAVLTPEQKKRLKEIQLQAQGIRALTNEEVVNALKITDEQKKKIEEIREANRPQFGRGGQGGGERPSFERFQEQQKETEAKIMDVLTAEQKSSFEAMKGKKFDMPRPTFGGNRPDGGRRPGGEGGNRPGGSDGDAPRPAPRPEPEL
jgi:Spy/CpxP family protein refolding chaperone